MGQVQSGGSFDVDYKVEGPFNKVILEGEKERQGDFVFTAQKAGDYSFCFDNEMSTFAEKFVDFEIAVGGPAMALQVPMGSHILGRERIAGSAAVQARLVS